MLFDSILRMVLTLASQYYRMVALPESTFGILGSAMALWPTGSSGWSMPRCWR